MNSSSVIQNLVNRLQNLSVEKQQHVLAALEDAELLISISLPELQALATAVLAPDVQTHLSDLLARNTEGQLSPAETQTLDRLLDQIDQLNILKARAQYTLQYLTQDLAQDNVA